MKTVNQIESRLDELATKEQRLSEQIAGLEQSVIDATVEGREIGGFQKELDKCQSELRAIGPARRILQEQRLEALAHNAAATYRANERAIASEYEARLKEIAKIEASHETLAKRPALVADGQELLPDGRALTASSKDSLRRTLDAEVDRARTENLGRFRRVIARTKTQGNELLPSPQTATGQNPAWRAAIYQLESEVLREFRATKSDAA